MRFTSDSPPLAPDPRSAFTDQLSNTERLSAAVEFVNSCVKSRFENLYENPSVEKDDIPKILASPDSITTLANYVNKTPQCCSMIEYLRTLGTAEPKKLLQSIVKSSVEKINHDFEQYRAHKPKITSHRLNQFFKKNDIDVQVEIFHNQINPSGSYTPVSRRATLLPPIRPPVHRPSDPSSSKQKKVSSKLLRVVNTVPVVQTNEDVVLDLPLVVENTALPPVVSSKSQKSSKSHSVHKMGITLLRQALSRGDIVLKPNRTYVFISPTDRQLEELRDTLAKQNRDLSEVSLMALKAHLLHKDKTHPAKVMKNEYGASFEFTVNPNVLHMTNPIKLEYPVIEIIEKPKKIQVVQKKATATYSINVMVIDTMIKPVQV